MNKVAGNIFAAIPIEGSDTDNYVVRNIVGIDPEHHLLAIGRKIKGGLYYSCMGRGENLFGNDSKELKLIQQFLGNFPLVGFFANGEIFYQRLHAYSGILSLFLE